MADIEAIRAKILEELPRWDQPSIAVPVVMTCALLLAFLFMTAMLLMDICYALIDPKVRLRYR